VSCKDEKREGRNRDGERIRCRKRRKWWRRSVPLICSMVCSDSSIGLLKSLQSEVEQVYFQWESPHCTIIALRTLAARSLNEIVLPLSPLLHLCDSAKSNTDLFLERLSDLGCATANQRRGEKL
jgi:hypothetical protein